LRFVAVAPITAEKPILDDPQPQNGPLFDSLIAGATRVTLAPGERRSISVSVTGR